MKSIKKKHILLTFTFLLTMLLIVACSKKQDKDAVNAIQYDSITWDEADDFEKSDNDVGNNNDDTNQNHNTPEDDMTQGDYIDDAIPEDLSESDDADEAIQDDIAQGDSNDDAVHEDIAQGNSIDEAVQNDIAQGDRFDKAVPEDLVSGNDDDASKEDAIVKKDTLITDDVDSSDSDKLSTPKKIIAIDAGHQSNGNNDKEPIGPGATTKKAKVSSGTSGVSTGVAEYELNLVISLKLKQELINRGYEVYMIRETNDVDISNKERADMANQSGADIFLRIHADSSDNQTVNGASTLYPSPDNPYVDYLSDTSLALSRAVIDGICEETGAKNRGAIARDDMSGINWCTIPVTIVEMGYMSNPSEDELMQADDYQDKIVNGICDGLDAYFTEE